MKKIFIFALFALLGSTTLFAQSTQKEVVVASLIQPEFPGGPEAMSKFMQENIVYPKAAAEKVITGTIYVEFIVEKDGKVTRPIVMRSTDPVLEAEAIRIISVMPNWKPGEDGDGNIVRSIVTLPIRFQLDEK